MGVAFALVPMVDKIARRFHTEFVAAFRCKVHLYLHGNGRAGHGYAARPAGGDGSVDMPAAQPDLGVGAEDGFELFLVFIGLVHNAEAAEKRQMVRKQQGRRTGFGSQGLFQPFPDRGIKMP